MKVVVIGLGSMGKRRIRLLKEHYKKICIYGVDMAEARRAEAEDLFGIDSFSSLDEVLELAMDCAFVCTAPLSHSKLINQCLIAGLHVFTELNLVNDGYLENIDLAKDTGKHLFISSTFLYRNDIRYLVDAIQPIKTPLFYTYHVGQYLPDWHPWESFKDFFVANERSGGGGQRNFSHRNTMASSCLWRHKNH